jgi:integrase
VRPSARLVAENPVSRLESGEKRRWAPQKVAIIEGDDLARLLAHAGVFRPLFEVLAHTGLRIGGALGLTWADVDYNAGALRVHRQLSRRREHAPLKTPAGKREVILAPSVSKLLRERWLASSHKSPDDFIFSNTPGRPWTTATSARVSARRSRAPGSPPPAGSRSTRFGTRSPRS